MTAELGPFRPAATATAEAAISRSARRTDTSFVRDILEFSAQPGVLSLAGGMPANDVFDITGLRVAATAVFDGNPVEALQYGKSAGNAALRQSLVSLMEGRGLQGLDERSILVTTGSSQGIDLVGRVLLDPKDVIVVERPTFLNSLSMVSLCDATVLDVPVDSDGMDLDALDTTLRRTRVKFLYTMPTYSNPSGALLPADRRRRLLELASEHKVILVEDDPYGLLWFNDEPPRCLAAMAQEMVDPPACVYLSTFSKVIAPGLRIGWMVAPEPIIERSEVVKQVADTHTSSLDQAIIVEYLRGGRLTPRAAAARAAYADRMRWLATALKECLPEGLLEFEEPRGGMFLWCRLHEGSARDFTDRAIREEVAVVPGDAFFAQTSTDQYLRLSFSMVTEESAQDAACKLASAVGGKQ